MNFFNLFYRKDKFSVLVDKINNCKNQKEIDELVFKMDVTTGNYNKWVNSFNEKYEQIELDKTIMLLDSLYREYNLLKFSLFSVLLKKTYKIINQFITPIEKYDISIDKYNLLIPLFTEIIEKQDSDIVEILLVIMINNDPKGNLLSEIQKNKIIDGLNYEYELIIKHIKKGKPVDNRMICSMMILLDYSTYVNNKNTIKKVIRLEEVFNEIYSYDDLYELLINFKKVNNLEITSEDNDFIIKNKLSKWLEFPTELGVKPYDIEITRKFVNKNGVECNILKFKKEKDSKWLIGIVCDDVAYSEMSIYTKKNEIRDAEILRQKYMEPFMLMTEQENNSNIKKEKTKQLSKTKKENGLSYGRHFFYKSYKYAPRTTAISIILNLTMCLFAVILISFFYDEYMLNIFIVIFLVFFAKFVIYYILAKATDKMARAEAVENICTSTKYAYMYCIENPDHFDVIASKNARFAANYKKDKNGVIVKI